MTGGDYGRVRHTFWTDPDIKRALSPEQKALLLYYFTGPHRTLIGLYYCPLEYAASETGLPIEDVKAWTEGALSKFVTYDWQTEEILVHSAGKHQVGEMLSAKDNQRKAIEKALTQTHSRWLVRRFLELYEHWELGVDKPEVEAPCKPLPTPSEAKAVAVAVTEQEQSKPVATREDAREPAAGGGEAMRIKVDLEAFATEHEYGPRDRLIAIGEDITAWRQPTGEVVPYTERLRCLTLAEAHRAEPDSKAHNLRSALKYVIAQQFDPIGMRTADEMRPVKEPDTAPNQPAPDDLDKLKAEYPTEYAEALAEFETYSWWESAAPMWKRSQLRSTVKERIDQRGAA